MLTTPSLDLQIRGAFVSSAQWFAETVTRLSKEDWSRAALGDWQVRELVGHVSLNCRFIAELVDPETSTPRRTGPFAFWDAVLASETSDTLHRSIADAAAPAAIALGDDPASSFAQLTTTAVAVVERSPIDAVVRFGNGAELALVDYLPSRIVEFVVHGLDLYSALDRPPSRVPADALTMTAGWLAGYADPVRLIEALTGRDRASYNVFSRTESFRD